MIEERLKLLEQQIQVLRSDLQQAVQAMLKDTADTMIRMAQNISKDMDGLENRIKLLESGTEKVRTDEGGKEL